MGHALNGSIQDCLIRYHRMRGRRTKWILGTDHAGIATQKQVERALQEQGTSREELGREAFVERVWEWREQYGGTIIEQFKRLGATVDYERRALHARRGLRAGGHEGLRRPLRQGRHLPRPLPGQLGPGLALGDLRPRGRGPRGHRHAVPRRLPARGRRRDRRGHRASGDDAGRHRRRRAPGRRPLPRPRRPHGGAAARRPPPADRRRRLRQARLRHRRAEDHARPRPQRLRDRPPPRPRRGLASSARTGA